MEYIIGIVAATAVGLFATIVGFDKDRSFYPVVLIVIATLYLLFAAMANSTSSLLAETIPALVFVTMAVLGFRKTPWLVVAGLALHGVFDFFHHAVIANPGVPVWWPGWCLSYDVVAAAYLAVLILTRKASPASCQPHNGLEIPVSLPEAAGNQVCGDGQDGPTTDHSRQRAGRRRD